MSSEKAFRAWGEYQEQLESSARPRRALHEGTVWRCAIGTNIGHEIDGKSKRFWRPVVIMRVLDPNFVITVPLTSKRQNRPYHEHIPVTVKDRTSYAVVTQIRGFDTRRLQQYIAKLDTDDFQSVQVKVLDLLSTAPYTGKAE